MNSLSYYRSSCDFFNSVRTPWVQILSFNAKKIELNEILCRDRSKEDTLKAPALFIKPLLYILFDRQLRFIYQEYYHPFSIKLSYFH